MRASPALALAVLATVAAGSAVSASSPGTSVKVAFWANGSNPAPDTTWTLRCHPPGGTLSRPGVACRRLAAGGPKLFAPVPPDMACTEIYGGPQKGRVVGTVSGRRVWATFTRENGCEIARWDRLAPWLVPRGGVPR